MDVPTMCDVGTKNQTKCKPMIENGISNDDVGIKNKRNVNSWLKMRFPMMMLELKKK